MSGLSSFARVCIRLIITREIVGVAIISFVSRRGDLRGGLVPQRGSGMSVNLRMLRRIDKGAHGEQVEAVDGAVKTQHLRP